jgi:hypothetical protein
VLVAGAVVGASAGAASADPAVPNPRPIDETGNNVANPTWGTPNTDLIRGASGARYGDGISSMDSAGVPSPRAVSNAVFAQSQPIYSRAGLSDYIWTWGQFLDHDLSLTPGNQESAPIAVPTGDPSFDPQSTGAQVIPFHRAVFDTSTGTSASNPRQQINLITGYIDGSQVYGSDSVRASWLRTGTGGTLKVTQTALGDLLPYNDGTMSNAGSPEVPDTSNTLFVAGDVRSNEQPTLACMHTLFVREHNRLAAQLQTQNPTWSDEDLYQKARNTVIAEIQHITYDEFLPALLGVGAPLSPYKGYDASVNPGVAAVFSTAAYRLGHTLLSPMILRLNEDGSPVSAGPLSLRASFFQATPPLIMSYGIEPYLRGLAAQRSQELDRFVIDDVRNFLFGQPGSGGLDLPSLNVQRGRDIGLPRFNDVRADYNLARKQSFSDVTSDSQLAAALASMYGSVDLMDVFVGFLVEDHIANSNVGETLFAVLSDQFTRSRAGDRYWYETYLSGDEVQTIKQLTLSDIIRRNTSVQSLQNAVFFARPPQNTIPALPRGGLATLFAFFAGVGVSAGIAARRRRKIS